MKNTAFTLLTGLVLATAAQAGSDYSPKGKTVIAPPAPSCLWTWFAGGSVGTIQNDWDEEIYTLHVGLERNCPGSSCSHALYLEVGFTEKDDSYFDGGTANFRTDVEAEVIPITLNYKYECALTGSLNWYIGAGAGVALVDASATGVGSDDETVFYGQVFTGLVYNVSESFEIFGGARYIFMNDIDFFDGAPSNIENDFTLDEGIQLEIGARFNF